MRTFEVGETASFTKTITDADIALFAVISGDTNPLHIDSEYARKTRFGGRIAHGILTASLISTVIGTKLPGTGAIYLSQTLNFIAPVKIGDTITATGTVCEYDEEHRALTIETVCHNQNGEAVLDGEARILYRP